MYGAEGWGSPVGEVSLSQRGWGDPESTGAREGLTEGEVSQGIPRPGVVVL